jgi:ribosomal protein S18 acetylase RimI-like enzyme
MEISQRDARSDDIEWLEPFYKSIMRPYYVAIDCEWDDTKFREYFDPNKTKIIQADGIDIGMLKVEERADCVYLCDIQIASTYRNKGIGTHLIETVIKSANLVDKSVRLRVLNGNPARNLYLRLGFREIEVLDDAWMMERPIEIDF